MNRKSVAVLDVRSAAVTALIGERGVNNTFVFKGIHTSPYDGFADAEFFDLRGLQAAVVSSLEAVERSCGDRIREIFVGVPGEFVKVVTRRHLISFQSKRRIAPFDLKALFDGGFTEPVPGYTLIRQAAVSYITSDKRRTIDPVGMVSDSIEGYLSYFLANDRFIEILSNILEEYGVKKTVFLPTSLAEALYLIPSETRDECAILLDIDSISMTFSIVCGNGMTYQSACSAGGGHVVAQVFAGDEEVGAPFGAVEAMIGKINLSGRDDESSVIEYIDKNRSYTLPVRFLKEKVKDGLDLICEVINKCLELCDDKSIDYKPILLTGGGITGIRGAREHLTNRLNKVVEIIAPNLPYYDKASQSSALSLLDMALTTKRENSFFYKLFNGFGG